MGRWNEIDLPEQFATDGGSALDRLPASLRQESGPNVEGEQLPMCRMSG